MEIESNKSYYINNNDNFDFELEINKLFSPETIELKNIIHTITPFITSNEFTNECHKIKKIICRSYKSKNNDIEDLSDLIVGINLLIEKLWTNKENCLKFSELVNIRKIIKKLAHSKYREGHDYIFLEKILEGTVNPKCIQINEKSRNYYRVNECELQYTELINSIWIPTNKKIENLIYFLNNLNYLFPEIYK